MIRYLGEMKIGRLFVLPKCSTNTDLFGSFGYSIAAYRYLRDNKHISHQVIHIGSYEMSLLGMVDSRLSRLVVLGAYKEDPNYINITRLKKLFGPFFNIFVVFKHIPVSTFKLFF